MAGRDPELTATTGGFLAAFFYYKGGRTNATATALAWSQVNLLV
jgi:hypothetical protein